MACCAVLMPCSCCVVICRRCCVQLTRAQLLAVGEAELLDACNLTKIPWTARDKRTLTSMYYKQDK